MRMPRLACVDLGDGVYACARRDDDGGVLILANIQAIRDRDRDEPRFSEALFNGLAAAVEQLPDPPDRAAASVA